MPPVQSTSAAADDSRAVSSATTAWPLLQSLGPATDYTLKLSMEMVAALNAHERSETEFRNLCSQAGLRLTNIYHCRSQLAAIEVEL